MASDAAMNNMTQAIRNLDQSLKRAVRILEAINQNMVEFGVMIKEEQDKEEHDPGQAVAGAEDSARVCCSGERPTGDEERPHG